LSSSVRAWLLLYLAVAGCGRVAFDERTDAALTTTDAIDGSTVDATETFGDFTDPSAWEAFDLTTLAPGAAGYTGAAFDGRYTYYVPSYNGTLHGLVARHDTQRPFTDAAAWSTFDTATVNVAARGYDGGAFDGRYVYFVPHENPGGFDGVVARFDTQQAFNLPAAWSTFDTATVAANARGFYGARFDGRYLYLISYLSTIIARYDTQGVFTSAAAWTTYDLTAVSASAPAFVGGVFDGRYLYVAPFMDGIGVSGLVLRYDTQGTLNSFGAWSTFDTTTLSPTTAGFCGAAFDGRYVYLIPFAAGTVARFDTQGTFTAAVSWETFDATTLNTDARGFFGATFDGRFLYLAPYGRKLAARYDTQRTLGDASAWSLFDTTTVNPKASQFYGAVFDGGAVYLVPHGGATVARFAAKTPPSVPALPGYFGSFL
jgi:hypothetical protein